jgi:putative addiction module killer protein
VFEVRTTAVFDKWLSKIKDDKASARIVARISMLADGYFGNYKHLREKVYELKIDVSGGIRIYYKMESGKIIILLCGGDKSTQKRNIERAIKLSKEVDK